jgi:hypothetical protein
VIACIALFVAMGGVSYGFATGEIDSREIANGGVTTKDIRNNEVRGRDIRNSTIVGRDVAFDTLTGNDIKESTLSGVLKAEKPDYATLPLKGGLTVPPGESAPGFDVDGTGYVHLRGTMSGSGSPGSPVFTLPVGARPPAISRFVVASGSTDNATLIIAPTGDAFVAGGSGTISIDGVVFAPAA